METSEHAFLDVIIHQIIIFVDEITTSSKEILLNCYPGHHKLTTYHHSC